MDSTQRSRRRCILIAIATLGLGRIDSVDSFVGPTLAGGAVGSRIHSMTSGRLGRLSSQYQSGQGSPEAARISSAPMMSAAVEVRLQVKVMLSWCVHLTLVRSHCRCNCSTSCRLYVCSYDRMLIFRICSMCSSSAAAA